MRLCLVISVILFFFYVHEVFLCAGTLAYLADSTNGHDDIENGNLINQKLSIEK